MKKEVNEKKKFIERLDQIERNTFQEILDLEDRLELGQRVLKRLISKENSMEWELRTEEENLKQTELELSSHHQRFRRRLRQIYKHGRFDVLAIMFTDSSPLDLKNRMRSAKTILKEDQNVLQATRMLKADLEERRASLGKAKPEVSWLKKAELEEQMLRREDLEEKKKLLRKIRSERKLHAQAIQELEEEASEISRILAQPQQEEVCTGPGERERDSWFETLRGKLPWPVQGRVASHFGEQRHPRFYTKTENSGILIQTKPGGAVAVAEGRVVYVSRLRGYGNFLILEHADEFYTLYARLSEVLVTIGEAVERLQRIGIVADDGLTSPPCLYFEIRKGKQPQDPLEWLR